MMKMRHRRSQHRTANEESGQCRSAVDGSMTALFIRGSVLAVGKRKWATVHNT
jgi:hypothetical protein